MTTEVATSRIPSGEQIVRFFRDTAEWGRRTVTIGYQNYLLPFTTQLLAGFRTGYGVAGLFTIAGALLMLRSQEEITGGPLVNGSAGVPQRPTWLKVSLIILSALCFVAAGAAGIQKNAFIF